MKNRTIKFAAAGLVLYFLTATVAFAQSTAFTYQGKLSVSGGAANGDYEMRFTLEDVDGFALGEPVTIPNVAVRQGIFTVEIDFGAAYFDASDRFLKVEIRPAIQNPPAFTALAPRQKITFAPKSLFAKSASFSLFSANSSQFGGLPLERFLRYDDNGKVGVGTSAPNAKLEVVGDWDGQYGALALRGDKPSIRFSGGAVSGNQQWLIHQGSSGVPGSLQFYNGGTTGNFGEPKMSLSPNGKVGIGTSAPTLAKLQVNGGVDNGIYGSSNFGIGVSGQGTSSGVEGYSRSNGGRGVLGISVNGIGVEGDNDGSGNFAVFARGFLGTSRLGSASFPNTALCLNGSNQISACGSSLRYKKDFQPFNDGLSFINQLRPISYKWKSGGGADIGFGAEDVAKINPLFAVYNDKGEVEGLKYDRLSVVFVNAFKEQQAQIERQNRQIARQQTQSETQQKQIDELKKLACGLQPQADICR